VFVAENAHTCGLFALFVQQ